MFSPHSARMVSAPNHLAGGVPEPVASPVFGHVRHASPPAGLQADRGRRRASAEARLRIGHIRVRHPGTSSCHLRRRCSRNVRKWVPCTYSCSRSFRRAATARRRRSPVRVPTRRWRRERRKKHQQRPPWSPLSRASSLRRVNPHRPVSRVSRVRPVR